MSLGPMDLYKLMSQAGKLKENAAQLKENARRRTVEGASGAGMVVVTANGLGEILSVKIDPEALSDPDTLGPLITGATNLAIQKSKEVLMKETQNTMGIELPPGLF